MARHDRRKTRHSGEKQGTAGKMEGSAFGCQEPGQRLCTRIKTEKEAKRQDQYRMNQRTKVKPSFG
jgi:hypothetical protein